MDPNLLYPKSYKSNAETIIWWFFIWEVFEIVILDYQLLIGETCVKYYITISYGSFYLLKLIKLYFIYFNILLFFFSVASSFNYKFILVIFMDLKRILFKSIYFLVRNARTSEVLIS
jgi:hypothetical protein